MVIFDPGKRDQGEAFEFERQRLEALLADFEKVQRGVPIESCVQDAPILDHWVAHTRPVPCLVGLSTGHPLLAGRDRPITTSDLWLLSSDRMCARTLSRWYRLGRCASSYRDVS